MRPAPSRVLPGLLCLAMLAAMARGEDPPRVLILFSNDRLLPANQRYDEGIRRALDPEGDQSAVTFFAEFLDAIRLGGPDREEAMAQYLERRYRDIPPRVLVALGPQATRFLVERRESLFPGAPLVFGGVGQDRLGEYRNLPGVAGLPMELTIAPTLEALLAMRPGTREVLLVHGVSDFDRQWRDQALRQCESFADRVRVVNFPELPLPELKVRLAGLPPESAVIYLTYFLSPTGETYVPAQVAAEIAAASAVPVMGPYDTYIGSGVLGVSVSPFEEEGMVLGRLIRRLLAGESPEDIGVLPPNPPRLILDDRQVERWGIRSVPEGAERRHRTPTLWEAHRAGVVAAISVMSLQGLLIAGLVFARLRQKRAERELRFSEERFSGVFRGSPAAISILRQSDGRIVDVNPEWESATGVGRHEAIGRTPLEVGMVVGSDAEARYRLYLDSGMSLEDAEQIIRTPDGRTRLLSVSTELLTLNDEPCYIVVAKDVTELREAEEARRHLAHTSRLAMLGEMTASIAHEINQPLGAILSNTDAAEMLLEKPVPELGEVRQILSDIRRDDLRASAVIERVRALVGREEIRRAPLDLNRLLEETLKLVKHDAQRCGATLIPELAGDLPEVLADPVQVEQVLLNLLLNAMDAVKDTPAPDRLIVVRSMAKNADEVEVSVEDRGHGIPPDRLSQVFVSFFTTKEDGMGLGLALARSIAESHGGSLVAENNAFGGATFRLLLPVNCAPLR